MKVNIPATKNAKRFENDHPTTHINLLSEMSPVCYKNELPVSWDLTIWCGMRSLGNLIFSLMRSLSF